MGEQSAQRRTRYRLAVLAIFAWIGRYRVLVYLLAGLVVPFVDVTAADWRNRVTRGGGADRSALRKRGAGR